MTNKRQKSRRRREQGIDDISPAAYASGNFPLPTVDTALATTAPADVTSTKNLPATANSAEALLSQAIERGANIDTLERLIALREKVLAEKAKEAFNSAMAAFQAECPVIKKTKEVKTKSGQVAYRYAPIESAVIQVKDLIQKHGFRYTTTMELNEGRVKAFCRVVHTLGHEEVSVMEVPLGNKTDIMSQSQVVAAASTFAKRYAFLNAFGIMTGDEDNDAAPERGDQRNQPPARAAVPPQPAAPKAAAPVPPPAKPADDLNRLASGEQVREIARLCKDGGTTPQKFYAWYASVQKEKKAPPLRNGVPTVAAAKVILDLLRAKTGVPTDAELTKPEAEKSAKTAA